MKKLLCLAIILVFALVLTLPAVAATPGVVTINASDFSHAPSAVFTADEDAVPGYLVIVDGWWTATWSELGVTRATIHYAGGTFNLPLTPEFIAPNNAAYWFLPNTESQGQEWEGTIPAEVAQTMTRIEVFMPQFDPDQDPEDPHGLVAVIGGAGAGGWWASTADRYPNRPQWHPLAADDGDPDAAGEAGAATATPATGGGAAAPRVGDTGVIALAIALLLISGVAFFVIRKKAASKS